MSDDPAKPPHFPYVAALLCAACAGMAVYLWMRYSYCWEYSPIDVNQREDRGSGAWPEEAYALLYGPPVPFQQSEGAWWHAVHDDPKHPKIGILVRGHGPIAPVGEGQQCRYVGRLYAASSQVLGLDIRKGRFTQQSIAGLVVGAMGVFVFTVALRHWLGERRRFLEKDEGA